MKTEADRQAVIALKAAGHSIRQIRKLLKMSRKTIRRILDGKAPTALNVPAAMTR